MILKKKFCSKNFFHLCHSLQKEYNHSQSGKSIKDQFSVFALNEALYNFELNDRRVTPKEESSIVYCGDFRVDYEIPMNDWLLEWSLSENAKTTVRSLQHPRVTKMDRQFSVE